MRLSVCRGRQTHAKTTLVPHPCDNGPTHPPGRPMPRAPHVMSTDRSHTRSSFPRINRSYPTAPEIANVEAYCRELGEELWDVLARDEARARVGEAGLREFRALQKALAEDPRRPRSPRQKQCLAQRLRALLAAALGDPTIAEHRTRDVGRPPREPVVRPPRVRWAEEPRITELAALGATTQALLAGTLSKAEIIALLTDTTVRTARPVPLVALLSIRDALPREVALHAKWQAAVQRTGADPHAALREVREVRRLTSTDYRRLARWMAAAESGTQLYVHNVGQRRTYRMLPLLRGLALLAYFRYSAAPHVQVTRHLWSLLNELHPQLRTHGIALELISRRPAAFARPAESAVQTTLEFEGLERFAIRQPSARTVTRYLETLPPALRIVRDRGLSVFIQQHMPRDAYWDATYPNEVWEVDSTPLDLVVAVADPDVGGASREVAVRVYLTVVQDVYSRLVVGYYLWIEPPNALAVGYALYSAMRPAPELGRLDAWLPDAVRADRGSEHRAAATQHVLASLEIADQPCRARRPNERFGERFMRTINERLSTLPGYVKHRGVSEQQLGTAPEQLLDLRAALAELDEIILDYNTTRHQTTGEAPLHRWRTTDGRRPPDADEIVLRLLRTNVIREYTREGVKYGGETYHGNLALPDGQSLLDYIGRRVRLYLPPPPIDHILIAIDTDRSGQVVPDVILGRLVPRRDAPRVDLDEQLTPGMHDVKAIVTQAHTYADPRRRRVVLPAGAARAPAPHHTLPAPPERPALGAGAAPATADGTTPGRTSMSTDAFAVALEAARTARAAVRQRHAEGLDLGVLTDFTIRPAPEP